ncbi:MAG: dihydropteroate synthase [Planctomycetaceae bacterium]|nr:dihydropteroate synthase [Planctomycetaceae bacterium]
MPNPSERPVRVWAIRGGTLELGHDLRLMGILNVTPDSFSDGGQYTDLAAAVDQAVQLESEGADIIDIGGESTRPGAEPVTEVEELRRVVPVIERLAGWLRIPISIDTYKSAVARAALEAGAAIVNDISGLRFDPDMPGVCAELAAGVVCMHIQGTPQTMQLAPQYDSVTREVRDYFTERLAALQAAGLTAEQIVWDPGIGFGKTAEHNLELLSGIETIRVANRPMLIGHSRKRFLQRILGRPVDERQSGTVGVTLAVAALGADIVRVHDVAACRDAWLAFRTVQQWPQRRMLPKPPDGLG